MRLYYVAARTRPDILTACSYASVVTEPTESDDMRLNPKYRLFLSIVILVSRRNLTNVGTR